VQRNHVRSTEFSRLDDWDPCVQTGPELPKLTNNLIQLLFIPNPTDKRRVLALHEALDGELKLLTKGDNNPVFDRVMYAPGQMWLKRSDIIGKAKGVMPLVGMATIYLNDYPLFKYALVGTMGFFVLTNKE
jgi:hypothetical protein